MLPRNVLLAPVVALALSCQSSPQPVSLDPAHVAEIEQWRQEREQGLRAPDGWLSLVGLYWLEEGANSFGSGPSSDLMFPSPAAESLGVFHRSGSAVTVEVEPGVRILSGGEPITLMALAADTSGEPTLLEYQTLSFYVIERGPRVGVRLKDSDNELLRTFPGMDSFPISPRWRLEARFVPYREPKTVQVPNIIGDTFEAVVPGEIVFSVGGEELRLEPTGDPAEGFFLVFGDETNARETYGGGRFLGTDPPDPEGRVIVDFNKAYNPPCVFTPYATCPLPRPENELALRVEAGEKRFALGH